jgi:hypothetical protein
VVPARSLQLLGSTLFLIRRVIPEVDLLLPLTSCFSFLISDFSLLTCLRTEEMLKITIVRAMNKCSLFQNDSKLLVSPFGFNLMFLFFFLSLHFPGVYLGIGREYDQYQYQYQYYGQKFYRTSSVMQKVCFHVICSEIFRFPSVDTFQIKEAETEIETESADPGVQMI